MNIALVLSGGTGSRMGTDIPKQYLEAGGKPVISYCLETLANHEMIDAIQIVAAEEWQGFIIENSNVKGEEDTDGKEAFHRKFRSFSTPGENRQLSILNALRDIREYADPEDLVFIHDAARPMLSGQQIEDCLRAAAGHDGVMPVLPMKDTVYTSVDGKKVTSLLERTQIFAGQAPEVFRLEPYYQANTALLPDKILAIKGSTEPAVMAGLDVVMISGEESNFKITTMEDLKRFQEIVGR